jgi:hypothetical protein
MIAESLFIVVASIKVCVSLHGSKGCAKRFYADLIGFLILRITDFP